MINIWDYPWLLNNKIVAIKVGSTQTSFIFDRGTQKRGKRKKKCNQDPKDIKLHIAYQRWCGPAAMPTTLCAFNPQDHTWMEN